MELENKLMEDNQFDLGQDVVKDSLQQQQPRSASANEMIFTNDDELNEFLACNTAMEFESDTENLHEKDPNTKINSEKWIEFVKLNEIKELNVDDLENGPENEKLLEKDPKTKMKFENGNGKIKWIDIEKWTDIEELIEDDLKNALAKLGEPDEPNPTG